MRVVEKFSRDGEPAAHSRNRSGLLRAEWGKSDERQRERELLAVDQISVTRFGLWIVQNIEFFFMRRLFIFILKLLLAFEMYSKRCFMFDVERSQEKWLYLIRKQL